MKNPSDDLSPLRRASDSTPGEEAVERARQELGRVADPAARVEPGRIRWLWSAAARAVREAHKANVDAQLQVYLDDLNAIRAARQALSRVTALRAIEAAECAVFELRVEGESLRHAILARAHQELASQFAAQIAGLEQFRGALSPEMLDALRERALNELTESMKTASKSRLEFTKEWLLKLPE